MISGKKDLTLEDLFKGNYSRNYLFNEIKLSKILRVATTSSKFSIKFPISVHWSLVVPPPVLDITRKYVKISQFLQSSLWQGMFPVISLYLL